MAEKGKRILIAEDNVATLNAVRFCMEKAGFEVTTATSGQKAWEELMGAGFDLVITDFQMPGMTGGELCERMGEDSRLAEIPVILLTAKGFESDVIHHLEALTQLGLLSVREIVPKPFSPRELIQKVNACLSAEVLDR